MTLEERTNRRAQLIKLAKDSVVERAAKLFISQYRVELEHLKPGDQVSPFVPIGKDKFIDWVKEVLSTFFPEVSGATENEKILKEYAVQIASNIAQSSTEIQNPLRDYEVSKDPIYVRANKRVYVKVAQHMSDSNDTPSKSEDGIYEGPKEHSRYCPDHPGSMLRRVSDKVYQCPIGGELNKVEPWKEKFSYSGGHEVRFETGVQNQSNHAWNDLHPILPFLHPKADSDMKKHKGKDYDYEREGLYNVDTHWDNIPPKTRQDEKHAALLSKITKKAQYNEGFFGPTTMMTRQCPDHPGQQTTRVDDNVRQCPLDGKVYDFVHGFHTEDGKAHTGGSVGNQHMIPPGSIIIKKEAQTQKEAQASDVIHSFLYTHVLPHLGESAEYARRVLNYKFSRPNISIEQAVMDIKKADELAAAQQAESKEEVQTTASQIKSFTRG